MSPKRRKRPKLERDKEDGKPKPKQWRVTFTTVRTLDVEAISAEDAEAKARDAALFADEFPIDRDEITDTAVGWVDPEDHPNMQIVHQEGCWGRHCRHYDCETDDTASCYDEWCVACDP